MVIFDLMAVPHKIHAITPCWAKSIPQRRTAKAHHRASCALEVARAYEDIRGETWTVVSSRRGITNQDTHHDQEGMKGAAEKGPAAVNPNKCTCQFSRLADVIGRENIHGVWGPPLAVPSQRANSASTSLISTNAWYDATSAYMHVLTFYSQGRHGTVYHSI